MAQKTRSLRIACPHCATNLPQELLQQIHALVSKHHSGKRTHHIAGPGRNPILAKCKYGCGRMISVTEMKQHRAATNRGERCPKPLKTPKPRS